MLKKKGRSKAVREIGEYPEKFKIWNKVCRWIVLDSKMSGSGK